MGDLILLDAARLRNRAGAAVGPRAAVSAGNGASVRTDAPLAAAVNGFAPPIREFYFDLACPFSYLAAERVERLLGQVSWVPVLRRPVTGAPLPSEPEMFAAEGRAHELRLPMTWPDFSEDGFPTAMRVAAYAADAGGGAGGRFGLAALRLAFCGGYDLGEPEILAEAAAAAGLGFDGCLAAAQDELWDAVLETAARRLAAAGVKRLPAFRIDDRWFDGEHALLEAVSSLRSGFPARVPA